MKREKLGKGTLLVASPEIDQGFFYRSVILLCEHEANGSFGLVLNKPINSELPEELIPPEEQRNSQMTMRAGGPLEPQQLMLLHGHETDNLETLEVCEGVHLGGDLDLLRDLASTTDETPALLLFGYTAWPGSILEREYLEGAWFLRSANVDYIFQTPAEELWKKALRDMGGKYASLAEIPENLDLN